MEGFIVASINKKLVCQKKSLQNQSIRYTPVLGADQDVITAQFSEAFPDDVLIMIMPAMILQKNIQVLQEMEKQREYV